MPVIGEDVNKVIDHLIKEDDLDFKLRKILDKEIRRRIAEYLLIDKGFQKKYGMMLEEFEKNEMVKKKGYSFEVESDYHDWDSALDAMETLQKDMEDLCQRDQ